MYIYIYIYIYISDDCYTMQWCPESTANAYGHSAKPGNQGEFHRL